MNWSSNHHLEHKRSIVHTLLRKAEYLVTDKTAKQKEDKYVKEVVLTNGYKHWSFKIPDKHPPKDNPEAIKGSQDKFPVQIPYMQRTSEVIQRVFGIMEYPAITDNSTPWGPILLDQKIRLTF